MGKRGRRDRRHHPVPDDVDQGEEVAGGTEGVPELTPAGEVVGSSLPRYGSPRWPPAADALVGRQGRTEVLWRKGDLVAAVQLAEVERARDVLDRWELLTVRQARRAGVSWASLAVAAGVDRLTYQRRVGRMLEARGLTIHDLA